MLARKRRCRHLRRRLRIFLLNTYNSLLFFFVVSKHFLQNGGTQLTLAEGDFTLDLDGTAVVPGTPGTITAGTSVMATFSTTGTAFRGFLARADSDTLITVDILSLVPGNTDLQISGPCTTAAVSYTSYIPYSVQFEFSRRKKDSNHSPLKFARSVV